MKVIVVTALSVLMLSVALGVTGIAEAPESEVEATPAPAAPERWNVWGQAELEGLTIAVRPVACPAETGDGQLCVEVTAENPTTMAKSVETHINLMAMNNEPMMRVMPPPQVLQSQRVILQAAAGRTAVGTIAFELPDVLPFTLQLSVGGSGEEWDTGTVVAAVDTIDLATAWGLGPEAVF